jgi:hypothetical protein
LAGTDPANPFVNQEWTTTNIPEPSTNGSAIEQVNEIIEELKHALNEMEDVLETLELAERQKIDDERELEELKRALRRLHRPRDDLQRHP